MGRRKKIVTTAKHQFNYFVPKLLFWSVGRSSEAGARALNFGLNVDLWCDLQKVTFSVPHSPVPENGDNTGVAG